MQHMLKIAATAFAMLAGAPAFAATDAVTLCQTETLAVGTYVYQNGAFTAIEDGTAEGAAALNACLKARSATKGGAPASMAANALVPPEREPRCSLTMFGGSGYLCRPTRP